MVSIVGGSELGLSTNSGKLPGGQVGDASQGRSGEGVTINAVTGNLVVQRRDEYVAGKGLGIDLLRTYNSQGFTVDDNADNWTHGYQRALRYLEGGASGSLREEGAYLLRIGGEGELERYDYSSTRDAFVYKKSDGAYDTIALNSWTDPTEFTWTDGATRAQDVYDVGGRLQQIKDGDNNVQTLTYNGDGLLETISNYNDGAAAEKTVLFYDTTPGKTRNLLEIRTLSTAGSHVATRVRYTYDSLDRLYSVVVDLTPDDKSVADSVKYETFYTYDGESLRIASLRQSDGSRLDFTYEETVVDSGEYRVKTYSDWRSSGDIRTTTFTYNGDGTTDISSTLGTTPSLTFTSKITYNELGEVTAIRSPQVGIAAGSYVTTQFTYVDGRVATVTDGRGGVTTYGYDANGNRILERDALGNTVKRYYDGTNRLRMEQTFTGVDPDLGGPAEPTGVPRTTHYVYEGMSSRVRYVITPEGRVTEYRYNATTKLRVSEHVYTNALRLAGNDLLADNYATTMLSWVTGNSLYTQRRDFTYDFRGQLQTVKTWGGVVTLGLGETGTDTVTQYVYDRAGLLRSTVDGNGSGNSFEYDGLGRVTLQTDRNGQTTHSLYDDANNRTAITWDATGLTVTTQYDAAGRVVSEVRSDNLGNADSANLATTTHTYDRLGRRTTTTNADRGASPSMRYVYDGLGRVVEEVDALGYATEYVYNAASQVIKTIRYATALNAVQLSFVGGWPRLDALRPASHADDRTEYRIYDKAGRLVKTVDALGAVVDYVYDGAGQLLQKIQRSTLLTNTGTGAANQLATLKAIAGEVDLGVAAHLAATTAAVDAANDRGTRYFYDADGRRIAVLDGEGYLTDLTYDAAGRLTKEVRYATATAPGNRANGALETLRQDATAVANGADQWTYRLYNARGQMTALIDPENYLTEYRYDGAGNTIGEIRYDTPVGRNTARPELAVYIYSATQTLSALRPAWTVRDHVTFFNYDGEGRLDYSYRYTGQWRADALSTSYMDGYSVRIYRDGTGQILAQFEGGGSLAYMADHAADIAERYKSYDSQGRLVAELSPSGVTLLGQGIIPEADLVTVYTYDAMGRLTSRTEPVDATGRKERTLYYYDRDSRLTHIVNALGEVTRSTYNAFDNTTTVTRYGKRIDGATLLGLTGGLVVAGDAFSSVMTNLASAPLDSTETFSYDVRGAKVSHKDALSVVDATMAYNAFGELFTSTLSIDGTRTRVQSYGYDRRGLQLTDTIEGAATAVQRDAFGRITQTTDARGAIWSQGYDRLGRMVSTTAPGTAARLLTYDAIGRVLTQRDALGNTTTYSYNDATRTQTVITPEQITVTTTRNAFGQVVSLVDGRGNETKYTYDLEGELLTTKAPIGTGAATATTSNTYDAAGHLLTTSDANGIKTRYTYDAVGRVLTRTVDPHTTTPAYTGLNLTTRTLYDAKGQAVWTQDAAGTWTQMEYDLKGQVKAVVVDPLQQPVLGAEGTFTTDASRLNLRTEYEYDQRGLTLKVTEGAGSSTPKVTQYTYDDKGRRTAESVDPLGLDITTNYAYDANDNVIARVDANQKVTRFIYDAKNQLIYSVDPTGAVAKTDYDAEGRVVQTTAYADRIGLGELNLVIAVATLTQAVEPKGRLVLANSSYATNPSNQVTRTVYDKDGRVRFTVDGTAYATEYKYDKAGNRIATTRYANALQRVLAAGEQPVLVSINGSVPPSGAYIQLSADDRTTRTVYDKGNRATFTIDAANYVTQYIYDAAGNVIRRVQYADQMDGTFTDNMEPLLLTSASGTAAQVIKDAAHDRTTRTYYDAAGRMRFSVDAEGYLTAYSYNQRGDETLRVVYGLNHAAGSARPITDADTLATLNTLSLSITADDVQHGRGYDRVGRLESEAVLTTQGIFDTTRYGYDKLDRVVDTTGHWGLANAATTHRVYDAAGRVTEVYEAYGHPEQTHVRYELDKMGNRKIIVDARGMELVEQNTEWAKGVRQALRLPELVADLLPSQKAVLLAMYTTTQEFDDVGRLRASTDALGGVTQTTYDAFGNAVKVVDPNGNAGYFYFDANNRLRLSVDPERYATRTEYNAFGEVSRQTRYDAKATAGYSETTSLQAMLATSGTVYVNLTPAKDVSTWTTYNKRGHATYVYDAMDVAEIYTFDAFGDKRTFTDRRGATYDYDYDHRGLMTSEKSPPVDVSVVNPDGTVWTSTEKLRITNKYTYDARGNLTHLREGFGTAHAALYGFEQERLTVTQYDALNRATRTDLPTIFVFNPAAGTSSLVVPFTRAKYDSAGNKVEAWDEKNQRSLYYYDRLNRLVANLDVDGALHEYEYDAAGNLVHEKTYGQRLPMASQAWTQRPVPVAGDTFREMYYGYNANNLQTSTATQAEMLFDPDRLLFAENGMVVGGNGYFYGSVITYTEYDANGNVVRTIDGRGYATQYFYDKLGRQTLVVDTLGYVTQNEYDQSGHVIREWKYAQKLSDVVLTALTMATDPLNTRESAGGVVSIYDTLSRKVLGIDATGQVALYSYDADGNQSTYVYPTALPAAIRIALQSPTAQHHFDHSVLADAVRGVGQDRVTEYDYDVRGLKKAERKLSVRYTVVGLNGTPTPVEGTLTTTYGYDANGNLKTETKPGSVQTDYDYDALNRVVRQYDPGVNVYTGGTGTGVTVSASVRAVTESQYDYLGRRVQEKQVGLATTLDDRFKKWRYDAAGNTLAEWDAMNFRTDYDIDAAGNILRHTQYSTDVDGVAHTYKTYLGYDAKGKETTRRIVADEGVSGLQKIGETTFSNRNAYGDIIAHGVDNTVQQEYRYDKLGRLFWSNADTGTPTLYLYDANGNAAMEVKAVDKQKADLSLWISPAQMQELSPDKVQMKFTLYDARNQATDVFQAPMIFDVLSTQLDLTNVSLPDPTVVKPTLPPATNVAKPQTSTAPLTSSTNYYPTPVATTFYASVMVADDGSATLTKQQTPVYTALNPSTNPDSYNGIPAGARLLAMQTWNETAQPIEQTSGLPATTNVPSGNVRTITEYIKKTTLVTHSYAYVPNTGNTQIQETITTTETMYTKVTTIVTTTPASKTIDYVTGEVTNNSAVTVTTVANNSDSVVKKDYKNHTLTKSETVVSNLAGGEVTRQTSIQFFGWQRLELYSYAQASQYGSGGWGQSGPIVDFGITVPPINSFGSGPATVIIKNQTTNVGQQWSHTQGLSYPFVGLDLWTDIYNIKIQKNGFTLLDWTGSASNLLQKLLNARGDASNDGSGYIQTPATATVQGVAQSVTSMKLGYQTAANPSATAASGPAMTKRAGVQGTTASWDVILSGVVTGFKWSYDIGVGSQVYSVEGDSLGTPNSRRLKWIVNIQTQHSRSYTSVAGSSGGAVQYTPTQQAQQQTNYLQRLMYLATSSTEATNVIHRQQRYNAFGEIVSETDGRTDEHGDPYLTQYEYNELGKLIKKIDPETSYTNESGVSLRHTPETRYYIDALGNTVGQRDANGFDTTQIYGNGWLLAQFNPNGTGFDVQQYYYDIFGNLAAVTKALDFTTRYTYDKNDRRISADFAGDNYDLYEYDAFGQMIKHTNGVGDIERYRFDGEGRITSYRSFENRETWYEYEYRADIGNSGGYRKITHDAMNTSQSDDVDVFGITRGHTDLGNRVYTYNYNDAGWLTSQTSVLGTTALQNISYTYYNNGYLASIVDHGIDSEAQFQYDKGGNRIFERYAQVGVTMDEQASGRFIYQMAVTTYDELGRIVKISDGEGGAFVIDYTYDKVGNRRSVHSTYWDLLKNTSDDQTFWYKYDAQNRFTTTMGKLVGNQIVRDKTGYDITYNALNQRATQTTTAANNSVILERYTYDANGFLRTMKLGSSEQVRSERINNAVGDLKEYKEFNAAGFMTSHHKYNYDKDHNMTQDLDAINQRGIDYHLLADGRLDWMLTFDLADLQAPDVKNTYTYVKWDSYLQSKNKVEGIANSPIAWPWKDGESRLEYDVNGHVLSMYDNDANRMINYVNNQNGQTLKRMDYDKDIAGLLTQVPLVVRMFYYFNGRAVGDQGSDHVASRVDYAQTLRASELEGEGNKTYIKQKQKQSLPKALRDAVIQDNQHRDIGERVIPVTSVDFDQNFLPINRDYPAHTPGSYTVQAGETLEQIASKMWGDSSLWYLIADANSFLSGNMTPAEYTRLTIPNVVTNIHNNSTTFRPFEPGLLLGNIQPTLPRMPPPPPPKKDDDCGGLKEAIVMIVTVAVAVFTGGLSLTASPWVSGLIAGAAGSIAGQTAARVMGMQHSISWSQVATSAIGGSFAAGMGMAFSGIPDAALRAGIQAATASTLSQGIGVATGLQKKFSWTAVAAAGLGAAAGQYAGGWAKSGLAGQATEGPSRFIQSFTRSLANGATQSLVLGGKPNWAMVAAQSFVQSTAEALDQRNPNGQGQQGQQNAQSGDAGNEQEVSESGMAKVDDVLPVAAAASVAGGARLTDAARTVNTGARATASRIDEVVVEGDRWDDTQYRYYDYLIGRGEDDDSATREAGTWMNAYKHRLKSDDAFVAGAAFAPAALFHPRESGVAIWNTGVSTVAGVPKLGLLGAAGLAQLTGRPGARDVLFGGVAAIESVEQGLRFESNGLGSLYEAGLEAGGMVMGARAGLQVGKGLSTLDRGAYFDDLGEMRAGFAGEGVAGKIPLSASQVDEILSTPKGQRPDPATYLSTEYRAEHAALFEGGAVRIQPSAPSGKIGRTETWVLPKSVADDAISQAGGNVGKLEQLLGFDKGYLGNAPVRVDIPSPTGYRIPTGNEFGANNYWRPGGYTWPGGLPEAVIDSLLPGHYSVKPAF